MGLRLLLDRHFLIGAHGLSPTDPLALSLGPVVTAAVMLVAVAWPAIRAARETPLTSIRLDT